ncbi:MAG TPA: hypothetical protein VFZ34_09625, partial [Blastocatellia bacterium]|nr:hypothetical protein [Blastocatellia bacterium]
MRIAIVSCGLEIAESEQKQAVFGLERTKSEQESAVCGLDQTLCTLERTGYEGYELECAVCGFEQTARSYRQTVC